MTTPEVSSTARMLHVVTTTPPTPPTTLLDTDAVAERLGVKPQTVRDYAYRGDFPKPDVHVGRALAWWSTTVDEWEASRS